MEHEQEWTATLDPKREDRDKTYEKLLTSDDPKLEKDLVEAIQSQDQLLRDILADFITSIRSIAQTEMTLLTLAARIDAINEQLVKADLVKQEDIDKSYQEKLQGSINQILEGVKKPKDLDK